MRFPTQVSKSFSLHENQKQQRLENLTNRRSGLDIEASPPVVPNLDNGDEPVGEDRLGRPFSTKSFLWSEILKVICTFCHNGLD